MPRPIPIGVRGEAAETVELEHTIAAHHPELPPEARLHTSYSHALIKCIMSSG